MQDRTAIILAFGSLLLGYGPPWAAYLILRRKAQRSRPGQPILLIPWWTLYCWFLSAALFLGASLWTTAIGNLLANLITSSGETCRSLTTQDQCRRAALNWQEACIGLGEGAVGAFLVVVCTTRAEAKRSAAPPERGYPFVVLAWSHGLLVVSWLLCSPLAYPLELSKLVGTERWPSVSIAFAFISITAYICGTALWIIALVRVYYARPGSSRIRNPAGENLPGGSERDVVLQEV